MQIPITVGRRKNAIARVKLSDGSGKVTINNRELEHYFPLAVLRSEVLKPFEVTETLGRYDATIRVLGGGHYRSSRRREPGDCPFSRSAG